MVSFTITVQSLQDAVVKKSIALATTLQEQQETITTGLQTVLYAKSWYDWLLVQVGFEDDTTENEAVEALS